jgi:uncharacterized protein YhaN
MSERERQLTQRERQLSQRVSGLIDELTAYKRHVSGLDTELTMTKGQVSSLQQELSETKRCYYERDALLTKKNHAAARTRAVHATEWRDGRVLED